MKALTILIPVYNTEKYIKRCLDSVLLNDILDDIEVLAVSDGSKDKSVDIIKEYEKRYPKTICLIEKENGGHGSTINVGIQKANGKYFRVLDSDDWLNTLDLVKFVKRLKNEEVDLVVDNYQQEFTYDGKSEKIVQDKLIDNKIYYFDDFDINKINRSYFAMANSTYKTSILRESGLKLYEKTFYVDMQYNIIPILKVKNFKYYNLDLYRYFIGRKDQSMNLQNFVKNRNDHEKVMKFLISTCIKNRDKISDNKYRYIENITKLMLNTHYSIYCMYFNDKKRAYEEVKIFDKYLYDEDKTIYEIMNKISYIKFNRKTHFIFVRINNKIVFKTISLLKKFTKRKGEVCE